MADRETPPEVIRYFENPILPPMSDTWAGVLCRNCGADPADIGTIQRTIQLRIYEEFPFHWVCRCGFNKNPLIPHHDDCPCTTGNRCEILGWFELPAKILL